MATKVPQPTPAFPWHNGPSATPCSLPKVSPHILLLAWCLAELLLKCFGITWCKQSSTRDSAPGHCHGVTHPVWQHREWSLFCAHHGGT